jgi:hypothetical protein
MAIRTELAKVNGFMMEVRAGRVPERELRPPTAIERTLARIETFVESELRTIRKKETRANKPHRARV